MQRGRIRVRTPLRGRRPGRAALLLVAMVLLGGPVLAACGGDGDDDAPAAAEIIELETSDGLPFVAEVRDGGGIWVLFGHQFTGNRRLWDPLAEDFHQRGYSVLTWDFRGHGETPDFEDVEKFSAAEIWREWLAAVNFAVAEGATAVYAIGASMGGTSAMVAASMDSRIDGVAAISSPNRFRGLDALENLDQVTAPKLFIAGEGDLAAPKFSRRFDEQSVGPHELVILDTDLHGNTLAVDEEFGPIVLDLLRAFVPSETEVERPAPEPVAGGARERRAESPDDATSSLNDVPGATSQPARLM